MNDIIEHDDQKEITKGANILNPFANTQSFELAQRMVKPLASSDLVPEQFRGNTANCLIALNMANRMSADPFMIMQSIYVVHGKPAFASSFLIGLINSSGMLKGNLKFNMVGDPNDDSFGCYASGVNQAGEELTGPTVTIGTAKAEGWYGKKGSKWPNMPELMLRYRAAGFWSRVYAPELTLGIRSVEEAVDIGEAKVIDAGLADLNEALKEKTEAAPALKASTVNEDGNEVLIDSTGEKFNPEQHATNDKGEPSLTKAGRFRKKRKATARPVVSAGVSAPCYRNGNPPHKSPLPNEATQEPDQEPEETEVHSDNYSPTLKSMLMAIDKAEDSAAIERVANHPFARELSEVEGNILGARCQERGAELAEG